MEEELYKKVREIEQCHSNNHVAQSWRLIREITGKGLSQPCQIKGVTTDDRLQAWYNHFKSLLGSPPDIDREDDEVVPIYKDLPIDAGPFTNDEYQKAKSRFTHTLLAKSSLKAGKCCGEDGLVPEVLKRVPIDDLILNIINKAYNSNELPQLWTILNIIPIPKSGDLTKTDNYRGISLCSAVAKVYNRMLLNRICPVLDPLLRTNQNGFRQKRSTIQQILALRRLIEGIKEKHLPAVILHS